MTLTPTPTACVDAVAGAPRHGRRQAATDRDQRTGPGPSARRRAPGLSPCARWASATCSTALPALRGLRTLVPRSRLVLAAPEWLTPVARLSGAVDEVVPTQPLGRVDGGPYDLAVNLHGCDPRSTDSLRRLQPDELWAYDGARRSALAGRRARGLPLVPTRRGLRRACDRDALDLAPPPSSAPSDCTVIHPGAAFGSRRWPAARWAEVARQLAAEGHRVVVTGSDAKNGISRREWPARRRCPPTTSWPGRLELADLCALIARARLVLTVDNGVGHLATAYRTPSVVLFGPVGPDRWGPPPHRTTHRALWAGTTSDPCADDARSRSPALRAGRRPARRRRRARPGPASRRDRGVTSLDAAFAPASRTTAAT